MITVDIPADMDRFIVAKTFAAYLMGSLAFANREFRSGPFRKQEGSDDDWQLDASNDFFLHFRDGRTPKGVDQAVLNCRYDGQCQVLEAMADLFRLRYLHA